jgi:regulator of sirC expression with transglutaminase-like and TPR domain
MPVAPVVDIVIFVKAVFTAREGDEDGLPAVFVMIHPHVGIPLEEIIND